MDISLQLFTGSCVAPADLNIRLLEAKIRRILQKVKITSMFVGWHKDIDISDIIKMLKDNGTEVFLWLPVFSELDALTSFSPLIGYNREKVEIDFDMGNGENFVFCCPSSNINNVIEVYEKYFSSEIYDGVFLDKIRYPSFIGGISPILTCFCDNCMAAYGLHDPAPLAAYGLHDPAQFFMADSVNPLGLTGYKDLRYGLDDRIKKLFDFKCDVIYHALESLCAYFRDKGLKIGFDLFAPFLAYFVGQDYYKLSGLADIVKPMFYGITNAPAGIPFEIDMYAKAFDSSPVNAEKRRNLLMDCIGFEDDLIGREIDGIKQIIKSNAQNTKLYAGIEFNRIERIAPVTSDYIMESITRVSRADGIVASWDLNTIPDSHIDCLLDTI